MQPGAGFRASALTWNVPRIKGLLSVFLAAALATESDVPAQESSEAVVEMQTWVVGLVKHRTPERQVGALFLVLGDLLFELFDLRAELVVVLEEGKVRVLATSEVVCL